MAKSLREKSLLPLLLILVCVDAVVAQEGFFQRDGHAVAFSLGRINHVYVGSEDAGASFEYEGIGLGLSYIGPQLRATGLYARPEGAETFLDVSAMGWLLPSFAKRERRNTTIAIPIGFLVAWRRITASNNTIPFRANAILLGAGGTLMHTLNQRTRLELRGIPLAGITSSQATDAVGFSWAADAEARLKFSNVVANLGLTIGYAFRYQLWNVNGSRVFSDAVDELYDYTGTAHTMSVGIWF